ncbi:alpha-hydroxy-acid oxidizing protein [Acidaminococcus fermentans]|uniref:alpha-hydroxy-acid oxidizing protein n=1 Tax=Acidaminococcus fermentans TaxID=905 RepID=UPI000D103756|nr:alpha-hydroxy-acid oxidizing protein [Acidaminococcus fermentans]
MDFKEVMENARKCLGKCKGCPVCNGIACRNTIPGPGAKGVGDTAIRNYAKWQDIRVVMDTLCEKRPVDTSIELFGRTFKYPIFAGPVGAVAMHYSDKYNDVTYNAELVPGCADAGIAAFTGDGMDPQVMQGATDAIKACGGVGVPTVKPWNAQMISEKMELVKQSGAFAVAMDVDAAGLPFLKNFVPPAGSKSVDEMKAIIKEAGLPFIIKGIMSVKGALKAREAGASAIVVSNHGGRVLDQSPATAEVLEEIAVAVGGTMKILVDGGIRSGVDVFKALALGADAVLIARPFVNAVYGGGREGAMLLADKLGAELADTMEMCGAASLQDINAEMIRK